MAYKLTTLKTKPQTVAEHAKQGRPEGPAKQTDYGDWRVSQAFDQSGEEAHQPVANWLWDKTKQGASAANEFMKAPIDWNDTAQSALSAPTRIATNFLGGPKDMDEMMWSLAHAMNRGQQKLTGQDYTLGLLRGQKWDERLGSYLPPLDNSQQVAEQAKQVLPGALTYEPQGNLGLLLHGAADFVNPEDLGGALGARNLWKRFR